MSKLGDFGQKLAALTAKSVDEQAHAFLHAFVVEFQGKFEDILNFAFEFKKFLKTGENDLDELQAHVYLEKRGQTMTVKDFRQAIMDIDLDQNHRVAFIEFALFQFKKTLKDLFAPPKNIPPELLAALDDAIKQYEAVLAKKAAKEAKIAQLEATIALGGVKGKAAQNELAQMLAADKLEENRAEISSAYNKRKAEGALSDEKALSERAEKERAEALRQEQERLAADKAKKDEEERKKKEDSRARLAAKSSLWNQPKE